MSKSFQNNKPGDEVRKIENEMVSRSWNSRNVSELTSSVMSQDKSGK